MNKKYYIAPTIKAINILATEMLATSTVLISNDLASDIKETNRRRDENYDWSDPWN